MFKRLFFLMLGLGAGLALGAVAVRKLEAAQEAMRPANVAASAAGRAGGLAERISAALEEGRRAADAKQAELRAVYRVSSPPPGG